MAVDRRTQALGAAGTILLGLLLWGTPLGRSFVHFSFDLPFTWRLDPYVGDVALVLMDDASRAELDQPSFDQWDRALHAELIEKLATWKARGVVFTVPFDQPSSNDQHFARAAASFRKVAIGVFRPPSAARGERASFVPPVPALQRAAAWGAAYSDDENGVARQPEMGERGMPALADRTLELVTGGRRLQLPAPRWLNYYGPPGALLSYSYAVVLQDRLPAEVFSNKVVFVGTQVVPGAPPPAGGFRTPYTQWRGARSPAAELEATQFLNLARRDWLTRLSARAEVFLLIAVGGTFGWGLGLFRPLRAASVAAVALLLVTCVAFWLIWRERLWFAWMIPVCAQIPVAAGWSALASTWRLKREMRELEAALASGEPVSPHPITSPAPMATPPLPAPTDAQLLAPAIPNHQLIRCIGHGAYGDIWLARDELGLFRAVKLLFRDRFKDKTPFEREYRGILQYTPLSRTHHGLVHVLHLGRDTHAGYFYYVMELADCEHGGRQIDPATYAPRNLARELDHRGPLPAAECVRLGLELAEGLAYLHSRQLVHRDIKPANIIYVNDVPKLADVGLVAHFAEARRDDKKLGTEGFVPPEGPGTPAADIYSLGKVLCEASLGQAAAARPTPPEVPPERAGEAGLPELVAIIRHACDESLALRYASVQEMQADLMRLQEFLAKR